MSVKKMVGSFVLKQFIIYDMRNFSHFSEVVLDRLAFADSDTEFAEAIEEFLTMYSARVTVICEGLTQDNPLFAALLNAGVGNIVCDKEIAAMQREITECLSDGGMTCYNPKERAKPKSGKEHYNFACENIRIAVLSSQPRMGATTAAIGLTAWLHGVGATVCDMGANVQTQAEQANSADIRLLVCGTKPYELSLFLRLKKQFETTHAFILCPFVDEDSKAAYAEVLQSDYHKVLFPNYQPDLMDSTANAKLFKTMITKYIAGGG